MNSEAGNDLVEHEGRAARFRECAQLLQEGLWPQRRVATLHGLHEHGRDFVAVRLNPRQALRIGVGQDRHVGDCFWRDSGRDGKRAVRGATAGLHQHLVELAMIVVREDHDPLAAGHGTRNAHCRHHRFGARVAEGDPVVTCHLRHERGHLAGQHRLRPDGEAFVDLSDDGCRHEIRRVAEHGLAKAVDQVDILVAVYIPEFRPLGPRADDRIDQFLPILAEACRGSWIGVHRAIPLRHGLGKRRAFVQSADQAFDIIALGVGQSGRTPAHGWTVHAHAGIGVVRRFRCGRRLDERRECLIRRRIGARHQRRCRQYRFGRQGRLEMGGEQRRRRQLLQQLPERDAYLELLLKGAGDLAEQERIETEF